jgi:hypothetical protein
MLRLQSAASHVHFEGKRFTVSSHLFSSFMSIIRIHIKTKVWLLLYVLLLRYAFVVSLLMYIL